MYIYVCIYIHIAHVLLIGWTDNNFNNHHFKSSLERNKTPTCAAEHRARTHVLPQARKLHVYGSGTFRAFWTEMTVTSCDNNNNYNNDNDNNTNTNTNSNSNDNNKNNNNNNDTDPPRAFLRRA